jgi:hypothetical protein
MKAGRSKMIEILKFLFSKAPSLSVFILKQKHSSYNQNVKRSAYLIIIMGFFELKVYVSEKGMTLWAFKAGKTCTA